MSASGVRLMRVLRPRGERSPGWHAAAASPWLAVLPGCLHYDLGEREEAEAARQAAHQCAKQAGHAELMGWAFEMSAWFALVEGRYEQLMLAGLADLGVVSRRQVGPTVLVRLERGNAAGKLVADLADLRNLVVAQLRELAQNLDPPPLSIALFGSFARGEAYGASDIDILAVRPAGVGGERWAASLTGFSSRAQVLTGNAIQVLDYDLHDLRRRCGVRDDEAGAKFWRSVTEDALTLAGAELNGLIGTTMPRGNAPRTVSRADATAYLAKSRSWPAAAQESLAAERWDAAAGSAVTAGINACHAISGALLGQRSGGGHEDAVGLLATAGDDGRQASRQLAQLLRFKNPAQYDPAPMAAAEAGRAVDLAARLAERAAGVLIRTAR